mgnify:CR=1 FL=1
MPSPVWSSFRPTGEFGDWNRPVNIHDLDEVSSEHPVIVRHRGGHTYFYNSKAFELARKRKNKVMSSEKANVMHTGVLWREEAAKLHKEKYADVKLEHMYADALAMQLLRAPSQFDVIVTDNLFGDILTDLGAAIAGGLGTAASANLNPSSSPSLFEPVHGSAPDIAGTGRANPVAAVLSASLLLDHLGEREAAAAVEAGAVAALPGAAGYSTQALGDRIATAVAGGGSPD